MRNSSLITIDIEECFMPHNNNLLGVPGALEDAQRTADFIDKHSTELLDIFASIDSHYKLDISHPTWWKKADGKFVDPFTPITADDILNGKYTPVIDPVGSLKYVQALESNKEFGHFIWPEHAIIGTFGQTLVPVFTDALDRWMDKNKKWVWYINKGIDPSTEHFGIFRANIPNSNPSTEVNQGIFRILEQRDTIYLAGQARTHCVANSLRQMLQIAPQLASKIVVLEDCMSNVSGLPPDFYTYVDSIYEDAKKQGVRFTQSTNV